MEELKPPPQNLPMPPLQPQFQLWEWSLTDENWVPALNLDGSYRFFPSLKSILAYVSFFGDLGSSRKWGYSHPKRGKDIRLIHPEDYSKIGVYVVNRSVNLVTSEKKELEKFLNRVPLINAGYSCYSGAKPLPGSFYIVCEDYPNGPVENTYYLSREAAEKELPRVKESYNKNTDLDLDYIVKEVSSKGRKSFVMNEVTCDCEKERGFLEAQEEPDKKKGEFKILRQRVIDAEMSEEAQTKAFEELDRLEAMDTKSSEASTIRTYIDWLLALPWAKFADDRLDLNEARIVLNEDHAGLDKVKSRILEYLAVMRRLRDSQMSVPTPDTADQANCEKKPTQGTDINPKGTTENSHNGDTVPDGAGTAAKEDTLDNGTEQDSENIASKAPPALRGPILCLVGPPGVGKTSLARSIARAMNRPFVRFSLGGIRDENEIRGHRRTYVGSMPGRIISLIKKAGVKNPLMLLDELDKIGSDWQGDPASALLEVLDPEQNSSFQDNYLDVGFDLGQVLFLCTANVRDDIPDALRDRLEVIELSGYTPTEKNAIAQSHLVPKSLESHGLNDLGIRFENSAIDRIIQSYTKEAGVRQLEREIAAILRKLAYHSLEPEDGEDFNPIVSAERIARLLGPEKYPETAPRDDVISGVVNGLAWTPFGGELLTIEATKLSGKGELKLTGKLGEVMQESAQIALSYVRARAERFGLAPDFLEKTDVHLHIPEGAIPKDGPSAGIAMAAALLSALTSIPAKSTVAMTGELTLRGMVLPIGGLKEKLLAAHRLGRKVILIPRENARHLEDIPEEVRDSLTIHLVSQMDEVIPLALTKLPQTSYEKAEKEEKKADE